MDGLAWYYIVPTTSGTKNIPSCGTAAATPPPQPRNHAIPAGVAWLSGGGGNIVLLGHLRSKAQKPLPSCQDQTRPIISTASVLVALLFMSFNYWTFVCGWWVNHIGIQFAPYLLSNHIRGHIFCVAHGTFNLEMTPRRILYRPSPQLAMGSDHRWWHLTYQVEVR